MTESERRGRAGRTGPRAGVRDDVHEATDVLLRSLGHDPNAADAGYVAEMLRTAVKLLKDGADLGQLKLVNTALKELRYAYRVFNRYRGTKKISIFGSARTPENHPDYAAARRFGELIAAAMTASLVSTLAIQPALVKLFGGPDPAAKAKPKPSPKPAT